MQIAIDIMHMRFSLYSLFNNELRNCILIFIAVAKSEDILVKRLDWDSQEK